VRALQISDTDFRPGTRDCCSVRNSGGIHHRYFFDSSGTYFVVIYYYCVLLYPGRTATSPGKEKDIIFSEPRPHGGSSGLPAYHRQQQKRSWPAGDTLICNSTRARHNNNNNNIILCLSKTFSFHVTRVEACVCVFSQRKRIAAGHRRVRVTF